MHINEGKKIKENKIKPLIQHEKGREICLLKNSIKMSKLTFKQIEVLLSMVFGISDS